MARDVDTLVVFCTNRGQEIFDDQIESIEWACTGSHFTVAVDDRGDIHGRNSDSVSVIRSNTLSHKRMSGFKNQEAICWAINNRIRFRRVMQIDDDLLLIGRGIDEWAADVMEESAIDLLGVEDRVHYHEQWSHLGALLLQWVPESVGFMPWPDTIFYSISWLSSFFAEELYDRGLLVPNGYDFWLSWPDVYISWMAQVLGFYTKTWGSMDIKRPPLFADHPDHMTASPQPWFLRDDFKAYHSVRAVSGFSELAVRQHYASVRRGEAVRDPER